MACIGLGTQEGTRRDLEVEYCLVPLNDNGQTRAVVVAGVWLYS